MVIPNHGRQNAKVLAKSAVVEMDKELFVPDRVSALLSCIFPGRRSHTVVQLSHMDVTTPDFEVEVVLHLLHDFRRV